MNILGISAFYHDSAAALIQDGRIVAAVQEERYTRKKHDAGFPSHAIEYCLAQAGISAEQIDYVGFYEKPLTKFERLLETYLAYTPAGFESFRKALPLWLSKKLFLPREMDRGLGLKRRHRYVFCEHHESHAASAFFPSPYDEAAIITMDGVGEWATSTLAHGTGRKIRLLKEIRFPHSVGLLYSAFTYYTGFEVNEGEYKLMGLAPYGKPVYADRIRKHLIDVKDDGSFWMDMSYFNYAQGLTMTSKKFHDLFGGPPKRSDEMISQRHMDLAASVQKVVEEVMLKTAACAHALTGSENLCLAGGVALNCVANGRVLREGPFKRVWTQPAAGDAGGALGIALLIWHQLLGNDRKSHQPDGQSGSLLGPQYDNETIRAFLDRANASYEVLPDEAMCDRVSGLMAEGKVIGWFQGKMEYGPRALGCRSIIGDARNTEMQKTMNLKVKFRESFRPFAPCVLREHAHEYFDVRPNEDSPYMLLVAPVREERRKALTEQQKTLSGIELLNVSRSDIPAVTHVDYSARLQTVDEARHPKLRRLMKAFHKRTGTPVIVNTSFNLSWEPIVNRPEEAYLTFMSSDIDALVLENCLLTKDRQLSNLHARRNGGGAETDPGLEEIWRCPSCAGSLKRSGEKAVCASCRHPFEMEGGIWKLFWPHEGAGTDLTEKVRAFYDRTPLPRYAADESIQSLIGRSRKGTFARLLGDQIPHNARVLEIGCGTGMLSNYLGVGCRTVVGTDLSLNSLKLAEEFRASQGLSRIRFLQMNLFKPALEDGQFDVVVCNGVLPHTGDPHGGFQRIARLVRPGGHLIVGLHNSYGSLLHDLRHAIFGPGGGSAGEPGPERTGSKAGHDDRQAGFDDRSQNLRSAKHTMGEALDWYRGNGFDFVNALPKFRVWDPVTRDEKLFEPADPGTAFDRALSQARMIVTGSRDGGFYAVIGRKKASA